MRDPPMYRDRDDSDICIGKRPDGTDDRRRAALDDDTDTGEASGDS